MGVFRDVVLQNSHKMAIARLAEFDPTEPTFIASVMQEDVGRHKPKKRRIMTSRVGSLDSTLRKQRTQAASHRRVSVIVTAICLDPNSLHNFTIKRTSQCAISCRPNAKKLRSLQVKLLLL